MEQLLKCSICKQEKPVSDFYKCKTWKRGYTYRCKACNRIVRAKQWDKELERNRKYIKEGKLKLARRKRRLRAIDRLGGKCECCGETQIEFLAFDHIEGLSGIERNHGLAADDTALKINKSKHPKETYRVLCHNCNSSIGFYGYCPHKEKKDFLSR